MYGKSDIYSAHDFDEFGKIRMPGLKRVFSKPGRGVAAILTGGLSEVLRGKQKRLKDLEARVESVVEKLNKLHDKGKMDKAHKRAQKLAEILDDLNDLAAKAKRPAKISNEAKAWAMFGEDEDLAKLERRLGKVLWSGEQEGGADDWRDDSADPSASALGTFPGEPGGMYIAAPAQGLVPTHDTGVRGGISIPPGGYAPAYTAVPPSQAYMPGGYDQGFPGYLPGGYDQGFMDAQNRRLRRNNRRLRERLDRQPTREANVPGLVDARPAARPAGRSAGRPAGGRRPGRGLAGSSPAPRRGMLGNPRGRGLRPSPAPQRGMLGNRKGRGLRPSGAPRRGMLGNRKGRGRSRMGAIDAAIAEEFGFIPGSIGIEAWEDISGSGISRADILESTAVDDFLSTDMALAYDDEDDPEVFGFVRRRIEKDLEAVRRKIERMNAIGIRNERDKKRFQRLMDRFQKLQAAMTETRERTIPLYADPTQRSLFQAPEDTLAEVAEGGAGLTRDLVSMPVLPTAGEQWTADQRLSRKDAQPSKHMKPRKDFMADPRLSKAEKNALRADILESIQFRDIPDGDADVLSFRDSDTGSAVDLLDDDDAFGGGWW